MSNRDAPSRLLLEKVNININGQVIEVRHVLGDSQTARGWYWRPISCFLKANQHGPFDFEWQALADAEARFRSRGQ